MFLDFAYSVTEIYIKDTICMKSQATNTDVWFSLMDSIRLFRILVFPSLKLGIQDFKAKSRRDSGLKVCAREIKNRKNRPWDYGIRGFVGRDYGIEEHHWGPSNFTFQKLLIMQ